MAEPGSAKATGKPDANAAIIINTSKDKKNEYMYSYIDSLNHKFGKPIVVHADTLIMPKKLGSHIDKKTHPITEVHPLLPYESSYRRLRYPFIGKI